MIKWMNALPAIWIYRIVRWISGGFFIAIGFMYEDAWPAFIFGGLFILTSFAKRARCIDESCDINAKSK